MSILNRNQALQGMTDALTLFPFALAVGACSPFGIAGGCMSAAVALAVGTACRLAFVPTYLALLPVFTASFRYGAGCACAAVLLGGLFMFVFSFLPQRIRAALRAPAVWPGFLIAAAFSTTALQTTHYFGIGAVGGTVPEMLRDYVSLGFHPNWRGILYGTIVMVVLITYPRKFKRLSRVLPAAFVSLLITFPLHLLLAPDALHSPVGELGDFRLFTLPDGAFLHGTFPAAAWPLIISGALSLAWIVTSALPDGASRLASVPALCGGFLGAAPMQTDGGARSRRSVLTALPLTALLFCTPALSRMPLPSLAVILIVTAWQSVDWSAARRVFSLRRFPFFLCAAVLPTLFGMHWGALLAGLAGLIERCTADRSDKT